MLKVPRYDSDIKEWNRFLEDKYKFGIWEFTFCLSDMIRKSKLEYEYPPKTEFSTASIIGIRKFKKKEIRKLNNLKSHIIKKLFESYKDLGFWEDDRPDKRHEKIIIEQYGLSSFFTNIDNEIESWKRDPFWNIRGRPIETKNKIISVWAQIMKDKRGINWEEIQYLFDWFFCNLKDTVYREELGEKDYIDQHLFKNEYYVIKRNAKTKRNLELLEQKYFHTPKLFQTIGIEFKREYIDVTLINKNNPHRSLIIFPNGVSFP